MVPRSLQRATWVLCLLTILFSASIVNSQGLPPGDTPPPTWFDRLASAEEENLFPDANYLIVYENAVNRVKETGVTYVDHTILYQVNNEDGARALAVLNWHYDPQSSFVDVQAVTILRDGEEISVPVDAVLDLPAPQRAIYWNDRVQLLQLPRLQPGDGVLVEVQRMGYTYALLEQGTAGGSGGAQRPDESRFVPPDSGQYFDIVLFNANVPMLEKRYTLVLPASKRLQSEVYNGTLYASTHYTPDSTYYSWWNFDIPPRIHEQRQPGESDFAPKVVMATAESWEAKSRWFFHANDNQFNSTPEIQAKVDEILSALPRNATQEEKAEALLHWVAQNIRYSGQTMGEGEGFTLHPGEMIFEQRSGVCKDIAGMLITMFRAAGFESNPAMTMAGSRIELVPADQFNHCVTALRNEDGEWVMYDPTWVPYNNDIWSKLETEQHYLVGSPEGEFLSQIPYSPPEESPLHITHTATMDEEGNLSGTFRFEGGGALDSRLRRVANYTRKRELRSSIEHMLEPLGQQVELGDITHRPVDNFDGDMWLEITYTIPDYALSVNGVLEFHSPASQVLNRHVYLFRAANYDWEDERETDVFLYYTQLLDCTEQITLPRRYTVADLPSSDEIDETYAYFHATSELNRRVLTVNQRAEVRRRQIPPEGFQGFRSAIQAHWDWADVIFRAEGGAR